MENKIQFAPQVMLVDVLYLNRVMTDLRAHFSHVLHRELPPVDLAHLLECISLDAGLRGSDNTIQVLFIYDAQLPKFTACVPSDLSSELHEVAFKGSLGEFSLYSFQPTELATREDLFTESLQLIGQCEDTKHLILLPDELSYSSKLADHFKEMKGKDHITVFGMNPPADHTQAAAAGTSLPYDFQILGFAILQALGVKPDEL